MDGEHEIKMPSLRYLVTRAELEQQINEALSKLTLEEIRNLVREMEAGPSS